MDAFAQLPGEINHLVSEFHSIPVVGDLMMGMTQYTFWLCVSAVLLLVLMFVFVKKLTLVPHGVFMNLMEWGISFVKDDVCQQIIGKNWKKHFPFLATLFFFILANNVVGVIPGMKPGSGTISTTAALALVVFIYFVACGVRTHGPIGYLKSLAPEGVMFPLNVLVWLIEVISTILRPITLAIRLFCNMFAGHIVMGSFAIMASLFMEPLIEHLSALNAVQALPTLAWMAILIIIYLVEFIVAFVQAYVFTVLSAVYIQIAEADEH